jgi:hypothetical protein
MAIIGQDIKQAADLLKNGEVVAIPTETVMVWRQMRWIRRRSNLFSQQKSDR